MDPHALDLTKHLSVNSVLKESVRSVIQAVATNPDVTVFFSLDRVREAGFSDNLCPGATIPGTILC